MSLTKLTTGTALVLLLGLAASTLPQRGEAAPPPREKEETEKNLDQLKPLVGRLGTLSADLVKAKKSDAEVVDALFAATLVRLPTEAERTTATKQLQQAKERTAACRDIAWALLNTKEFLKLHNLDGNVTESLRLLNGLSGELGAPPTDQPEPKKPPSKEP
jgi:hypothetical protein